MAYWLCQLLGWGFNAFSQSYSGIGNGLPATPLKIALEVASLNALALLYTNFLRGYMKRHGWHTLGIARLLPRVLAAALLFGLPTALIMRSMSIAWLWIGGKPEVQHAVAELGGDVAEWLVTADPMVLGTMNWTAVIVLWTILYFSITSLRDRRLGELRQSQLARALKVAELRLLKSQLNPHFLFNCLNSVRALIADDPAGAQRAVTQLARTLRYTLTAGQDEVVSLDRELEIVADYLELESLRLGERLKIERTIASEAHSAHIPVMLLQTVVENAIKHGIAELPQGGVLRISADMREQALTIEVENPRPAAPGTSPSPGVGLRNAVERLRLLFGAAAALDLDLSRPDFALARIRIPQAG
ncbi:MAG TPA: histidine kinase [Steroidobacteraceae bacterium]|jgi:LytS/YehU family sensor histidine kinase